MARELKFDDSVLEGKIIEYCSTSKRTVADISKHIGLYINKTLPMISKMVKENSLNCQNDTYFTDEYLTRKANLLNEIINNNNLYSTESSIRDICRKHKLPNALNDFIEDGELVEVKLGKRFVYYPKQVVDSTVLSQKFRDNILDLTNFIENIKSKERVLNDKLNELKLKDQTLKNFKKELTDTTNHIVNGIKPKIESYVQEAIRTMIGENKIVILSVNPNDTNEEIAEKISAGKKEKRSYKPGMKECYYGKGDVWAVAEVETVNKENVCVVNVYAEYTTVNGRKEYTFEDHVWIKEDSGKLKTGNQISFRGTPYIYTRTDGSVGYGLRDIKNLSIMGEKKLNHMEQKCIEEMFKHINRN